MTSELKSFYLLEMWVEPVRMREYFKFATADIGKIIEAVKAILKGKCGFYKLLCSEQHVKLCRIEERRKVKTLNLLPLIRVEVPGLLEAGFDENGKANICDINGEPIKEIHDISIFKKYKRTSVTYKEQKKGCLREILLGYNAFLEKEETVYIKPFLKEIGALKGNGLKSGERNEYYNVEAGMIMEQETEQCWKIDEFIKMMRTK